MMSTPETTNIPDRSRPGSTTTALSIGVHQGGHAKYATGEQKIKLAKDTFTTGTWNVRTLHADGKLNELEHEMDRYQWNVLGIAETRWLDSGESFTDEGHKIWWSGGERKHEGGVGLMVHKDHIRSVMECEPVSSRIIRMRLSASPRNLTIIQAYAPTSASSDEDIENFYSELGTTVANVAKKDIRIIQGDWNAKIGTDAQKDWTGTVGKFGVGVTNERGLRLLEFAKMTDLVIANTWFRHKISRRVTWTSPDGVTKNQIDHIMIDRKCAGCINGNKTRAFPGADIGSDHNLVMMTMKLKLKKIPKPKAPRVKYNIERLGDRETRETFQIKLGGRFGPLLDLTDNAQEMADMFADAMNETALEVLGKAKKMKQPWMNVGILEKCDVRRELKAKRYESYDHEKEYRMANTAVRKEIKKAKDEFLVKKCEDIQRGFENNNSKLAYETVKQLTKQSGTKSSAIEDKNGKLLTETGQISERWTEYVKELYNYPITTDASVLTSLAQGGPGEDDQMEEPDITKREIETAVAKLKNGKAAGFDNIPAELVKNGGCSTIDALHKICNSVWKTGEWPSQWTKSLIVPLHKKGSLLKCNNYRTISLISHPSKVLLRVICDRMKVKVDSILSEEQAGFRQGRSTAEQITNIRILGEKYRDHQMELHHNFIDFKKAFDRVWREALWSVMRKHNIGLNLVKTIEALYNKSSNTVISSTNTYEWFETAVGVRQGCILSPCLFNVFLEQIMMDALEGFEGSVSVGGRSISNLRFADDIDLIAGNRAELFDLTNRLDSTSRKFGMEISNDKSKVMVTSKSDKNAEQQDITVDGITLEEVNNFQYLGSTITPNMTSETEIKKRLAIATGQLAKLNKLWNARNISMSIKVNLLKSLITSIALYGCESWTLSKKLEKRIEAFELRCYRRLLGIVWKQRVTNIEVRRRITDLVGPQETLVETARRRKLQWFGHVTRRPGTLAHTIMHGMVPGSRSRGRPKGSWTGDVKEWTGLSMKECMKEAEERDGWKRRIYSSKCPNGPWAPGVT